MSNQLRILIVDDHPIARSGMRLLLDHQRAFDVIGEANSHGDALSMIRILQPDVVIIECLMSAIDCVQLTCDIKSEWQDIPVLAVTIHRNDRLFLDIIRAGASGYIVKDAEPQELFNAIHIVSQGEVWIAPDMALVLVQQFRLYMNNDSGGGTTTITSREKEILRMLAEGHSVNEVAERLFITPSTVHTHRSNIMTKLGLDNHRELIQHARKHGLVNGH